jgi:hypothetical protein
MEKEPFNNQQKNLLGFSSHFDYAPIVQNAATFFENILICPSPDLPDAVNAAICCRVSEIDAINGR